MGLGYTTGPDGRYAFDSIPAGRYVVSGGAGIGPTPMIPFEVTYATAAAGTLEVDVAGARRIELQPMRLPSAGAGAPVGRVQTADERGVAGVEVRLVPLSARGREAPRLPKPTQADGQFRLDAYAGARYVVQVARNRTIVHEREIVAGLEPLILTIPPQQPATLKRRAPYAAVATTLAVALRTAV
jgi:hypothetical protein